MSKIYISAEFNTRDLPQAKVKRLFRYDSETGDLIWRNRPREDFATDRAMNTWNARFAGNVAGTVDKAGYRRIGINGKFYRTHRLIYILHHGPIPADKMIDHVDNNTSNNRVENLRFATNAENPLNRGANKNNTGGHKGICFDKHAGKYKAQITVNGRNIHLGLGSLEHCAVLYEEAANSLHGEFARIA